MKVIPCLETYKYFVQIYRSQDTNTVLVSTIFRYFSSFTIYKRLHRRADSNKKVDIALKVRKGRGRIAAKLPDVELRLKGRSVRLCSSKYKVSLKSTRIGHRGFLRVSRKHAIGHLVPNQSFDTIPRATCGM